MDKTILMVQHASGEQEKLCPKCGQVMTFHEGGYQDHFAQGEHYQTEGHDSWNCDSCGFYEDEETDRYFMRAFGAA